MAFITIPTFKRKSLRQKPKPKRHPERMLQIPFSLKHLISQKNTKFHSSPNQDIYQRPTSKMKIIIAAIAALSALADVSVASKVRQHNYIIPILFLLRANNNFLLYLITLSFDRRLLVFAPQLDLRPSKRMQAAFLQIRLAASM